MAAVGTNCREGQVLLNKSSVATGFQGTLVFRFQYCEWRSRYELTHQPPYPPKCLCAPHILVARQTAVSSVHPTECVGELLPSAENIYTQFMFRGQKPTYPHAYPTSLRVSVSRHSTRKTSMSRLHRLSLLGPPHSISKNYYTIPRCSLCLTNSQDNSRSHVRNEQSTLNSEPFSDSMSRTNNVYTQFGQPCSYFYTQNAGIRYKKQC